MALNQLLFKHQLAKMHADRSGLNVNRESHLDLVGHYARRITELREGEGLSNIGWPRDERPKIGVSVL